MVDELDPVAAVATEPPKPIAAIGCMIVNRPDLLRNMLRSIDYPVDRVVLVHNPDSHAGTNKAMDDLMAKAENGTLELGHNYIQTFVTRHHQANLGFSAGVNQVVLAASDAAYWVVVNNDITFKPGRLQEIAEKMGDERNSSCFWGMAGDAFSQYSAFVLTPRAISTVGYFDENFWPAYGEDCDYTARLVKGNCEMFMEPDPQRMTKHHGSASWKTTSGTSSLAKIVQRPGKTFNNFDYANGKWGMDVCGSRLPKKPYYKAGGFARPFNRPGATVKTWKLDKTRRSKLPNAPSACLICNTDSPSRKLPQFPDFTMGPKKCVTGPENSRLELACPSNEVIVKIVFASYGTPLGSCHQGLNVSKCHAPISLRVLKQHCLGKKNCSIMAQNQEFGGDPCANTPKTIAARVKCGNSV